jgi:hypothetical protein
LPDDARDAARARALEAVAAWLTSTDVRGAPWGDAFDALAGQDAPPPSHLEAVARVADLALAAARESGRWTWPAAEDPGPAPPPLPGGAWPLLQLSFGAEKTRAMMGCTLPAEAARRAAALVGEDRVRAAVRQALLPRALPPP